MTEHDETRSSRRETKEDKSGNHDGTKSNRMKTKGDKSGNHDGTKSNRMKTKGDLEIMTEQDPVEGRQRETNLEITTK